MTYIGLLIVFAPFGRGQTYNAAGEITPFLFGIGGIVLVILLSAVALNWLVRKRTKTISTKVGELEAEISAHEGIEQELIEMNTSLDHQLVDALNQLELTNKELEAFAYSVSHDVRSPLRSILAYSEILLAEHADDLDGEGLLYQQRIRANAERLDGYIAGILDYSSLSRQELAREEIDLIQLVHQVFEDLSDQVGDRQIDFTVAELPAIYADRALIRVVLMNLISNAIKFTDLQPEAQISVGYNQEDSRVVFFVKDNGIGLEMKYAETIFETFQRLHGVDQYVGRGIGLALVRRIILRHGGNVWVHSESGQGSTFFFTIGDEGKKEKSGLI